MELHSNLVLNGLNRSLKKESVSYLKIDYIKHCVPLCVGIDSGGAN